MSTVGATIKRATGGDVGGFVAVASNGDVDRDGERIMPGCFSPLPESIPIHLDHTMRAASVVARGRPYYKGNLLMVDAAFSSSTFAQEVRGQVKDGTLDSLSIVFMGHEWREIDGVRTCVKGELLAADIVSVPSNRGARILTMRSLTISPRDAAREAVADGLLALARLEIAEAKSLGIRTDRPGPNRVRTDQMIRYALNAADSTRNRTSYDPRSL